MQTWSEYMTCTGRRISSDFAGTAHKNHLRICYVVLQPLPETPEFRFVVILYLVITLLRTDVLNK